MNAHKTFLALYNPYKTVVKVFPNCISHHLEDSQHKIFYLGVKQTDQISSEFIKYLEQKEIYHHTIDKMSLNGRAIDIDLKHPITGRHMTGSSSGTAVNVFLGINDIGLGTDGGGSVLAPALSLNLFSIVSPYFTKNIKEHLTYKISTDGIKFLVSYGFISYDVENLKYIVKQLLPLNDMFNNYTVATDCTQIKILLNTAKVDVIDMTYKTNSSRLNLIDACQKLLDQYDVIISKEGPIDVMGYGDTVMGHFDETTQRLQNLGNKGFLRVVNMCGFSAITIPINALATGYVCIVKSNPKGFTLLNQLLEQIPYVADDLTNRYFRDSTSFFKDGVFV